MMRCSLALTVNMYHTVLKPMQIRNIGFGTVFVKMLFIQRVLMLSVFSVKVSLQLTRRRRKLLLLNNMLLYLY